MMIRWTPFNELARLQAEVDRFFGPNGVETAWNPAFDVTEDAEKIVLEADLPGVPLDALDIQVEQNVLTVKGARKIERAKAEAELYRHYERVAGTFQRAFKLPPTVNAEKITASLKEGVLRLELPKRPEAQPRQIKVNVQA
jgi:HSP20 family protein